MKDIVDRIEKLEAGPGRKMFLLYGVMQTNYRQPLGDKAWNAMRLLFKNDDLFNGFAFLTGYITAIPSHGLWVNELKFLKPQNKKSKGKEGKKC